jgi:hypothetical protein
MQSLEGDHDRHADTQQEDDLSQVIHGACVRLVTIAVGTSL